MTPKFYEIKDSLSNNITHEFEVWICPFLHLNGHILSSFNKAIATVLGPEVLEYDHSHRQSNSYLEDQTIEKRLHDGNSMGGRKARPPDSSLPCSNMSISDFSELHRPENQSSA